MPDEHLELKYRSTPETQTKEDSLLNGRLNLHPCTIGSQGFCCKLCMMGPCRVLNDSRKGVCGSSRNLIVAKNILRFTTGGTAAHVGHARHLLRFMSGSRQMRPPVNYIRRKAPSYQYLKWREAGILPDERDNGYLVDMTEALHMTTLGVNSDFRSILLDCLKMGLIDGYYGLYLGTELEERHFGKPVAREGLIDLGCIRPDRINIALHGHEPTLADHMVKEAAKYREINLVGVCCTGSYLLSRHRVPMAAHFTLQEEVICTGLIEALVVDVQCIIPSIADICDCYHTKLVSTNELGRFPNAIHKPVTDPASAAATAREVIEIAMQSRANRRDEYESSFRERSLLPRRGIVGHTQHSVPTVRIADDIKNGRLKGVIGVIGCVNPRIDCAEWIKAYRELSREFIILSSGCIAFELGRYGLLDGKRIFHLGSCINNARIAETMLQISRHLGDAISDMPFLISAPAPISEKAMSIVMFFAAMGLSIHSGFPYLMTGAPDIAEFICGSLSAMAGSRSYFEDNAGVFMARVRSDFK